VEATGEPNLAGRGSASEGGRKMSELEKLYIEDETETSFVGLVKQAKISARDIFQRGKQVESTEAAKKQGVVRESCRGIVKGFGRQPYMIRVQILGRKSSIAYHMKFWRIVSRP
jgi:hypothetical protein